MQTLVRPIDEQMARRFLGQPRIAVVGASPTKGNFGASIARELRDHGTEVVTVHPSGEPVDDLPCHRDLASLTGDVDVAVLVVPAAGAADLVRQAAARGIGSIWLFRGVGSAGTVSDEAVAACDELGVEVVAGACPLMFLEPAGFVHRLHRSIRRHRGALVA